MEIDPTASHLIKIVTVGDHLVGKSCAITTYLLFQIVSLHQVLHWNVNPQYSIAQPVILKLMDQTTSFQFGTNKITKGHNRKLDISWPYPVLLQRCINHPHIFLCYRSRHL